MFEYIALVNAPNAVGEIELTSITIETTKLYDEVYEELEAEGSEVLTLTHVN